MTTKVQSLLAMHNQLKGDRPNWETHWRQVAQYVVPNKVNVFDFMNKSRGEEKHEKLYTGTAEHLNELLASALHSMLTNPTQQWFELASGNQEIDKNPAVREWFQVLVKQIHQLLNNSNFQTEIHEVYIDLGSLGTAVLRVMEDDDFVFRFTSRPIYEFHIKENAMGEVDTIFSSTKMTVRQINQKYGSEWMDNPSFSKESFEKNPETKLTVTHAIFPREDNEVVETGKHPFASVHYIDNPAVILEEKGFREFPYLVPRWMKISGEVYGRSPSMKALPDIRMENAVMRDTIRSAQKVTDPPLMVPDDGMINPTDTRPGGINYYRSGTQDRIFPLETKGQPRIGFEVVEDLRNRIKQHYFVDQLQLREGPQMTATEVIQRTDEQLRLMGPILGRQHFELLQPLIARILSIMTRKKLLPPDMPEELKGLAPEVKFVSQIARAQRIAEGENLNRVIAQLSPFAQADPTILDTFDNDALARFSSEIHGLPESILRKPEEVEQLRQQRQQQQQAQLEAQSNQQNADAEKKLAEANNTRQQ